MRELARADEDRFNALQEVNRVLAVDNTRPNRLSIDVDIGRPAMLVIAECWHPGWRAKIDGRRVPLWRVNYLQQGVWTPVGPHRIELSFFPPSMFYGSIVSALSLCIVVLVVLSRLRKNSRETRKRRSQGIGRSAHLVRTTSFPCPPEYILLANAWCPRLRGDRTFAKTHVSSFFSVSPCLRGESFCGLGKS